MKYGLHWKFPKIWSTFFIFFREYVIFFFSRMEIIKKRLFFHTSSWWHSLPSMQYINRWKLFLMCHCLSKMGIGSTDEMTSTWRCRLYHMAVSLAIKKNWQARIAVVSAEELIFWLQSLILHNLTHFVVMKSGDLAQGTQGLLEHLAGLSSSGPGLLLCRPSCCAAGLARTHRHTDRHAHSVSGCCILNQKGSGLVLILVQKSSVDLSALNSGLRLYLFLKAPLLVSIGLWRRSCFLLLSLYK